MADGWQHICVAHQLETEPAARPSYQLAHAEMLPTRVIPVRYTSMKNTNGLKAAARQPMVSKGARTYVGSSASR